jgi:hypothetical protein
MDCKHETLEVKTIIKNNGKPEQRTFFIIHCTKCNLLFSAMPYIGNMLESQLTGLSEKLESINKNIANLSDKMKKQ